MICFLFINLARIVKNFDKPGGYSFVLKAGQYTVQCYGAEGGNHKLDLDKLENRKGAYVIGKMTLTGAETTFYAYVGGKGESETGNGGFNGGGHNDYGNSGGGGATDLRIGNNSLQNRIIVAAGGSGTNGDYLGSPGGGIYGYYDKNGESKPHEVYRPYRSTYKVSQTEGNEDGIGTKSGGGGYRGGYVFDNSPASGSSYISGYSGCMKHSIVFEEANMTIGENSGDGKLIIESEFECPENCSTCISSTECTECFEGYLNNGKCEIKCPDDLFQVDNQCVSCSSNCATCNGSPNSCSSCKEGFVLKDNECIKECPIGTIIIDGKCNKCRFPCTTCLSSVDFCLSCAENYVLYENKCYLECPEDTIRSESTCKHCTNFCKTCYSSTSKCTSCIDDFYLFNDQCIPSCPDGYFQSGGQCVQCISPCKTCSSKDVCTTCIDMFYLDDGKCYASCPPSKMNFGAGCQKCKPQCGTCSESPEKCTSCADDYYGYENGCFSDCTELNDKENGHYYGKDEENKQCQKCGSECIDCSGNFKVCNKCSESFESISGICVEKKTEETSSEISSEETSSEISSEETSSEISSEETSSENPTDSSPTEEEPFPQTDQICFATYDNENVTLYNRCYFVNEEKSVSIQIITSSFTDFKNESNGGTVYVTNCQVNSIGSNFTNCVSTSGCGGAIYIKNAKNLVNHVTFSNLTFTSCKAAYGGAIYIYSSQETNNFTLSFCTFISNEAFNTAKDSIFGGSAVFLTSKLCYVSECKFIRNTGKGSAFKVYLVFESDSSALLSDNLKSNLFVFACDFENNDDSNGAIYLDSEKDGNVVVIDDCSFRGKLKKGEHFIDGRFFSSKKSSCLQIQSCKFDYDMKIAVNSNLLIDSVPIRKEENLLNVVFSLLIGVVMIVTASLILFYIKNNKILDVNDQNDNLSIEIDE